MNVYLQLALGIVILLAFGFVLVKNAGRRTWLHAFLRIDTIIGIIAGGYLVVTSTLSLLN